VSVETEKRLPYFNPDQENVDWSPFVLSAADFSNTVTAKTHRIVDRVAGIRFAERCRMAETLRQISVVAFSPQSSVAYFLKGILDCTGFRATAVSALDELEDVVHRIQPEAVVYDISFPFIANWQKLQQLRGRSPLQRVPIVVTTSEARELFRSVGFAGAIEIFARPDDVTTLREALRRAIDAVAPVHAA